MEGAWYLHSALHTAVTAESSAQLPKDSPQTVEHRSASVPLFGMASCSLRRSCCVCGMGQHPVLLLPDGCTGCWLVIIHPSPCPAWHARSRAVGGAAHRLEAAAFISNLDHGDFLLFHSQASFSPGFA